VSDLVGQDGKSYPHSEPIPGVFIPAGQDVPSTLRRLFPLPFYAALWAKHPEKFGPAEETIR
jgi:hypothetical protein